MGYGTLVQMIYEHPALERALQFIESWLQRRLSEESIPGLSVAIYHTNKPLWVKAFGLANIALQEKLTPDHLFQTASQTKMLTSVACLQLVESGKLNLSDRIVDYLPWLDQHPDQRVHKIKVRHLLSHSSGLPRDGLHSDFWLFKQEYPTSEELHATILKMSLAFMPGSTLKYSNIGYALLGEIVATVSGTSYAAYIKKHILKPLGLSRVATDYTPGLTPLATGYGLLKMGKRQPLTPRTAAKSLAPATGLYATPSEMCRFGHALCDNQRDILLSADSKQLMQQIHSEITEGYDAGTAFGLGHEFQEVGGRQIIGHGGHAGGHVTGTYFDSDRKLVVSAAATAKDVPSVAIIRGIFGILDFFLSAQTHHLEQRFDTYLANEMSTVQIVSNGERVVAIDPDSWEPFAWFESLEKRDATTLEIVTDNSAYNKGELLHYVFNDQGIIQQVRFAGLTHWPDLHP